MAYKMKFKNLEGVVDQLHNASKMHKRQAKIVEGHIDKMEKSGPPKKRGLWDNIHAKRRRGETMRKPGDPGAPTEQALKESQTKKGAPKKDCNCWPGHSRVPGTEPCAPGSCKKDSPAKSSNEPRKTTKGPNRNFRTPEEGAGMTQKGGNRYKAKNPGSNLQTAVTTPPSKLKPDSKDANRRKSFCARSRGWKGERGRAARARWNC